MASAPRLYELDIMSEDQALTLLAARLERPGNEFTEPEGDEARQLALTVGYLPLALELAAADRPWRRLEHVEPGSGAGNWPAGGTREPEPPSQGEAQIGGLFQPESQRPLLRPRTPRRRRRLSGRGVLPDDTVITAAMACTLWGTDEAKAKELLELLCGEALLRPGPAVRLAVRTCSGFRIHDLLHDFARRLLTAPARVDERDRRHGLGLTIARAHLLLIDRYKRLTRDGLWHTLPDDGYIHAHLLWHLERAGKTEEIHGLLSEVHENGGNAWFGALERAGQVAGYLADVNRAVRILDEPSTLLPIAVRVRLCCRYGLIISSINSLASNLPPTC